MYYVSVLIPMVVFSEKVNVIAEISKQLNVPASSIEFFELRSSIERIEYVVKVPSLNINLAQVNDMIESNSRLKEEIAQLKQEIVTLQETLLTSNTFQKEKEVIFLKRQNTRLKGLVTQYATNMSLIKNEASSTIQSIISSLKVEQAHISTQTLQQ